MDLYGWLIGSWDLELFEPNEAEPKRRRPGEWHFGWVLEGRAINDVWIVPPRSQRQGDAVLNDHYYGTTLRVYDPRIDAWHIQFTDPPRAPRPAYRLMSSAFTPGTPRHRQLRDPQR